MAPVLTVIFSDVSKQTPNLKLLHIAPLASCVFLNNTLHINLMCFC